MPEEFRQLRPLTDAAAYRAGEPSKSRVDPMGLSGAVCDVPQRCSRAACGYSGARLTPPRGGLEPPSIMADVATQCMQMMAQMQQTQLQTMALIRGLGAGAGGGGCQVQFLQPQVPRPLAAGPQPLLALSAPTPATTPPARAEDPGPTPGDVASAPQPPPPSQPPARAQSRTVDDAAAAMQAALARREGKERKEGAKQSQESKTRKLARREGKERKEGTKGPAGIASTFSAAADADRPSPDADGKPVHWRGATAYTDRLGGGAWRVKKQKGDRMDTRFPWRGDAAAAWARALQFIIATR